MYAVLVNDGERTVLAGVYSDVSHWITASS